MDNIDMALRVVSAESVALERLYETISMNGDAYSTLIETLKPVAASNYARRIIITGVGKNANIAAKASETFASLGIPSMFLNTGHYSHGDAGFIAPHDIVIHVSRSGKTDEMQHMARHLKTIRPDVVQVLLHCNEELTAQMAEPFDIEFGVDSIVECDENSLAPTSSTTVLLALLDTIGVILSSHIRFERQDFYKYHPGGALGSMLKAEV